jgi:hypothetical protein
MEQGTRPRACFFGYNHDKDEDMPANATMREMQLAMNALLYEAAPRSSSDAQREALMEATRLNINEVFPIVDRTGRDPSMAEESDRCLRDTDSCIPTRASLIYRLNCFSSEDVERVHLENKSAIPQPSSSKKSSSKRRRPEFMPAPEPVSHESPNVEWSEQQQAVIDCVSAYIRKISVWKDNGSDPAKLPAGPNILLFGGPGGQCFGS